ncbi:MAG: sulfite exporter TauE/SafE family protein [Desulfobacterales bacterium]
MITVLSLFGIGLLAGVLGALLGLGGGIFLVPLLTLLFDLPIRVAVGTSLVGVIATSAGVAAFAPRGRGGDVGLALRLEMATTAGAIGGSLLAGVFNSRVLHVLFAAIVFTSAAYTLYKGRHGRDKSLQEPLFREDYHPQNWPAGLSAAGVAGMVSGLLGVGGGFIKVPIMYALMNVPLGVATATSNFMVGITAAASVFVYYGRGDIYPMLVVPTAVGVFLGAVSAVYAFRRIGAVWVRKALVGLLVLLGVYMLFSGLNQ